MSKTTTKSTTMTDRFDNKFLTKIGLFNSCLNLFKNSIKQGCLITPYKGVILTKYKV